jgi:integrase
MRGKPAFCEGQDVKHFLKGYQRRWALKGYKPRAPIDRSMLSTLSDFAIRVVKEGLHRKEVAAAFLLAYWGLMRISEVAGLTGSSFSLRAGALYIRVRKSKNDQLAKGQVVCLPLSALPGPVERWLLSFEAGDKNSQATGPGTGPEFWRKIVKDCFGRDEVVFHSLRHGRATDMHKDGIPLAKIMEAGRWRSRHACLCYIHCK